MRTKLTIPVYAYYLVHVITLERGKAKPPVYFQPHHTHAVHAHARTHTHTQGPHPSQREAQTPTQVKGVLCLVLRRKTTTLCQEVEGKAR